MTNETKQVVFLRGKKTILRPITKNDVLLFTRWINDPAIRELVLNFTPKSEENEEAWIKSLTNDRDNIVFVVTTLDGTPIGTMGLHRIDWKDRVLTTGAMIGEQAYWGKGYGTDAKMTLLKYVFDELGFHKVCSAAIAYNKRSLAYSLHCGYRIEGTRKSHTFKRGKYRDIVELGLFRNQWFPIWRRYQKTGSVR